MLFQPAPRTRILKRAIALLGGIFAGLAGSRSDTAYLDGMRQGELEDLGLRRSDDGAYRLFK